jgi:hypothetical protein
MKISAMIESYVPNGHSLDPISPIEPRKLAEVIASIRNDYSTTIELASDKETLMVAASEGKFAATVMTLEDGNAYDLVGDASLRGWIEFVHGGQPADHPARHCVSEELVKEVVEKFLSSGRIDRQSFNWEQQSGIQKA